LPERPGVEFLVQCCGFLGDVDADRAPSDASTQPTQPVLSNCS
jgi:hypothetical protein